MKEHHYYVYILASGRNGTLHVGVTNDLERRTREHREGEGVGFTRKYGVDRLVWYEPFQYVLNAIHREKQLKRWRRAWKIALIEADNPQWLDLLAEPPTQFCHPGRTPAQAGGRAGTQVTGLRIEAAASLENCNPWVPALPMVGRDDN